MKQHGDEAHIGKFPVVLYASAAHSGHQVASEKAEFRRSVPLAERLHQVRSVQVARSLSCYQIIFHRFPFQFQFFSLSIWAYAVMSICVGVTAT